MNRLAPHLVNVTLLAGLFLWSLAVQSDLPDEFPRHFQLDGTPDAYWETSTLRWLLLPLVGAGLLLFLYGLAWFVGRHAQGLNVPNQAQFDALPLEAKRHVAATACVYLQWTVAGMLALFGLLQYGAYQVAVGASDKLPGVVLVGAVAFVVLELASVVWLARRTSRVVRELHERQHTER